MWQRTAPHRLVECSRQVIFASLLWSLTTTATGQESRGAAALSQQGHRAAVRPHASCGLLKEKAWASFHLHFGRIVVSAAACERPRNATAGEEPIQECYRLTAPLGVAPNLDYQWRTPDEAFTLDVRDGFAVTVTYRRREPTLEVKFRQPATGPVTLTIDAAEGKRTYAADSVWHFFLLAPESAHAHLAPLLESVNPQWRFAERSAAIRQQLYLRAERSQVPDTRRLERLIAQLGDPSFATRRDAYRQLKSGGTPLIYCLRRVDRDGLDAEQLARLETLTAGLLVPIPDRNERVSAWLSSDARIWCALLEDGEARQRQLAHRHLEALLQRPLPFAPDGPPALRAQQTAALMEAVGRLQR